MSFSEVKGEKNCPSLHNGTYIFWGKDISIRVSENELKCSYLKFSSYWIRPTESIWVGKIVRPGRCCYEIDTVLMQRSFIREGKQFPRLLGNSRIYVPIVANISLMVTTIQVIYKNHCDHIFTARWKSMSGLELSGFVNVKVPLRERKFTSWKVKIMFEFILYSSRQVYVCISCCVSIF